MNRLLDSWEAEYPGAIVYPANEDNVLGTTAHPPTYIVIHTPEEEADDYFATPRWFAQYHPNQRGSTNAAIDIHGFIWECVPPDIAPIANGVTGKPYPGSAIPNVNLNYQSRSVEVEGRAATMHKTCPRGSSQFTAVVNWCVFLCRKYGLDETRIIAHRDVASNRSDPGTFDMAGLRTDVKAILGGDDMDADTKAYIDGKFREIKYMLGKSHQWDGDFVDDPNANLAGWIQKKLSEGTPINLTLSEEDFAKLAKAVNDDHYERMKE